MSVIDRLSAPRWSRKRASVTSMIPVVVALLSISLVAALTQNSVPYRNDFAAYWPVGQLLSQGENPYDAEAIAAIQNSLGDDLGGDSVVRYPPWALPLLIPISRIPFAPAWYLWISLQLSFVVVSAGWMTAMLGDLWRPPIPVVVAVLFPATFIMALGGQIGGFLLLAATGFIACCNDRRLLLAGVCLGLLSIKPHLFIPLGLIALLWSVRERAFRVPITALATIGIGASIAWIQRPTVFPEYIDFVRVSVPTGYLPLSIGGLLRSLVNPEAFWLQWIPALVAAPLMLRVWMRDSASWNWVHAGPVVVALGIAAAPYGLVHDLVLLIPLLLLSSGLARSLPRDRDLRWFFGIFLAMSALIWLGQVRTGTSFVQVWVAPVCLLIWWFWRRRVSVCITES